MFTPCKMSTFPKLRLSFPTYKGKLIYSTGELGSLVPQRDVKMLCKP